MHFVLDIDGTIAARNPALLMSLYNKKLKLNIDEERLHGLHYTAFLELPEVVEHRRQVGEKRFAWNIRLLELDPTYQIEMRLVKDAVLGAHLHIPCLRLNASISSTANAGPPA